MLIQVNNIVCLSNIHLLLCRLVPGGLAESTGLLAVNDEVLEVNGIEVAGKSLDQVTVIIVRVTLGVGMIWGIVIIFMLQHHDPDVG